MGHVKRGTETHVKRENHATGRNEGPGTTKKCVGHLVVAHAAGRQVAAILALHTVHQPRRGVGRQLCVMHVRAGYYIQCCSRVRSAWVKHGDSERRKAWIGSVYRTVWQRGKKTPYKPHLHVVISVARGVGVGQHSHHAHVVVVFQPLLHTDGQTDEQAIHERR